MHAQMWCIYWQGTRGCGNQERQGRLPMYTAVQENKHWCCTLSMASKKDKCSGDKCSLCSGNINGRQHAHPQKWSVELQIFLMEVTVLMKCDDMCVCKACEVNVRQCLKKKANGEPYKLRWQKTSVKCCIPACENKSSIDNHPFSVQEIFDSVGTSPDCDPDSQTPLCIQHYQMVYRHKNASRVQDITCCVCGTKRKHEHSVTEASKFVPCPSPKFVESFLADSIGFESHISDGDVLCFRCYKYFNHLLKSGACSLSNAHILAELDSKEKSLAETVHMLSNTNETSESAVQLALHKTALHVCRVISSDRAVLFPDLYRLFLSHLPANLESSACISKYKLLTFIGSEFGDLISSFCHNKQTGTIFHRTKADLGVLLSNALTKQTNDPPHINSADHLNTSVHKLAKHFSSHFSDPSTSLILDLDAYINEVRSVAPELWDLVCNLTMTVNERKGRKAAKAEDTFAGRIKRLRRAYIVSVLLFVTNSECYSPFHVLLADAVESNGGSTELITILNRIGVVCSVDTLKRVIQYISQERKAQGIKRLLFDTAFTIATVDNVDYLQSNAAVYAGNQHRSYHATSIQIVQPQPLEILVGERARRRLFDSSSTETNSEERHVNSQASVPSDPLSRLRTLLSRKRPERSSPLASPQQSTRSPVPKKVCRARTFAEHSKLMGNALSDAPPTLTRPPNTNTHDNSSIPYTSFLVNESEKEAAVEVSKVMFDYFFLKEACTSNGKHMIDLKTFCGLSLNTPSVQPANVVYLSVVDMHADTREAMEAVVSKLHSEYEIGVTANSLVVVGDQKTYNRIQELKQVYAQDLKWLIPFIGDWHLLHNFHSVLMKVYYEAGLKDLAKASGFRGETLTSLQRCSNFKRVHHFLLQSWEAIYRHMLQMFISGQDKECYGDILSAACAKLCECSKTCEKEKSSLPLHAYIQQLESQNPNLFVEFQDWVKKMAENDSNWEFWMNFVFRDLFSYVTLFLSIRGGMWKLRLYGVKQIAPLFAAFDRPHYQKLLPCHLHEVLTMPQEVIDNFEKGAFVCNINGNGMHSVALDEAHEMLVNKDLKTTIVRPTKEYLDRVLYYFPVRSQALKVLKKQVLLDGEKCGEHKFSILDNSPHASKVEENVKAMSTYLKSTMVLATNNDENTELRSLSGQIATPEQKTDLLTFWETGLNRFENKVKYFILRDPSTNVPQRQAKLLTFASTKSAKKKIKLLEKEKKLVNKCVRRSLVWNAKVSPSDQQCGGQYLELPRAISDPHGNPNKGQKSYATKWLSKRYTDLISNSLPNDWNPEVVVLEGMFLINTSPLCTHQSMKDYSQFLLRRFVLSHLVNGSFEVHIVFDNPGRQPHSPKAFERQRRDDSNSLPPDHVHVNYTDTCPPPSNWREYLSCRKCKRDLVLYLGASLMQYSASMIRGQQRVVLAGCFPGEAEDQAWAVSSTGTQPLPNLNCGAEEADTRLWLHVLRSQYSRILVCSPDTDVYHIGFPLLSPENDVIVQLNAYTSIEHQYLRANKLRLALNGDPDLAAVEADNRLALLQALFIATGCDYTSFFAGIGKATFMRVAFQHCSFINENSESCPGTLVDTGEMEEKGFLAFVRLVGTAYFKKHLSCFQFASPRVFLNSFTSSNQVARHKEWFESIRSTVWTRIEFEDELPPSFEALWRHWLRTCWVSNFWKQAGSNQYRLLDITQFGWKVADNKLTVDWDAPENVLNIRKRVDLLLRGCSCKKGCKTKRCSCCKAGRTCGPGCACCNCENSPVCSCNEEVDTSLEDEENAEDSARKRREEEDVVETDDEDEQSGDEVPEEESRDDTKDADV